MDLAINSMNLTRAELSAYNKGFTAGRTGQPYANPYEGPSYGYRRRFYNAWSGGYHDAVRLLHPVPPEPVVEKTAPLVQQLLARKPDRITVDHAALEAWWARLHERAVEARRKAQLTTAAMEAD